MDALRNSKKISLLAVAILFSFTFFNLILDAPRTFLSWELRGLSPNFYIHVSVTSLYTRCIQNQIEKCE